MLVYHFLLVTIHSVFSIYFEISELSMSYKSNIYCCVPGFFNLTFHSHNHSVKSIIHKSFKLLQNDPETGTIFSQPPPISFKRDKTIGNFLVRSSFQTNDQPGTFKCASARCKTCPSQREQNIETQAIHYDH